MLPHFCHAKRRRNQVLISDSFVGTWCRIRWHTRGHFVVNLLVFI
jgi:hypothetical protein